MKQTIIFDYLNSQNLLQNPPIKIIVADDHELFRIGLTKIFRDFYSNELEIVAEATNGVELVEKVGQYRPQVVITDIQMPCMDCLQASKIIRQRHPETAILALSIFQDTKHIMSMLQAGVNGYLSKDSTREEVMEAIKTVCRKEPYYSSTVSDKVYGKVVTHHQPLKKNRNIVFGMQEKRIMKLICRQYCIKEIAVDMKLGTRTVEHYRQNIMEKIGARNVVGIALFAVVNEIVQLSEFL